MDFFDPIVYHLQSLSVPDKSINSYPHQNVSTPLPPIAFNNQPTTTITSLTPPSSSLPPNPTFTFQNKNIPNPISQVQTIRSDTSNIPLSDPNLRSVFSSHLNELQTVVNNPSTDGSFPTNGVLQQVPAEGSASKRNFVDVLLGSQPIFQMDLPTPVIKGNLPSIKLTPHVEERGLKYCQFALVGRLDLNLIKTEKVRAVAKQLWKPSGDCKTIPLGRGYLMFRFELQSDYDRVSSAQSWSFEGQNLRLQKWSPSFDPEAMSNSQANIWVKFPKLKQQFWDEEALFSMANAIGKPISLDINTRERNFGFFASIMVEVDMSKHLPDKMVVELNSGVEFIQEVQYSGLPKFCNFCKIVGHISDECRKIQAIKDGIVCSHCKMSGHKVEVCRKLKEKEGDSMNYKRNRRRGNKNKEVEQFEEDEDLVLVVDHLSNKAHSKSHENTQGITNVINGNISAEDGSASPRREHATAAVESGRTDTAECNVSAAYSQSKTVTVAVDVRSVAGPSAANGSNTAPVAEEHNAEAVPSKSTAVSGRYEVTPVAEVSRAEAGCVSDQATNGSTIESAAVDQTVEATTNNPSTAMGRDVGNLAAEAHMVVAGAGTPSATNGSNAVSAGAGHVDEAASNGSVAFISDSVNYAALAAIVPTVGVAGNLPALGGVVGHAANNGLVLDDDTAATSLVVAHGFTSSALVHPAVHKDCHIVAPHTSLSPARPAVVTGEAGSNTGVFLGGVVASISKADGGGVLAACEVAVPFGGMPDTHFELDQVNVSVGGGLDFEDGSAVAVVADGGLKESKGAEGVVINLGGADKNHMADSNFVNNGYLFNRKCSSTQGVGDLVPSVGTSETFFNEIGNPNNVDGSLPQFLADKEQIALGYEGRVINSARGKTTSPMGSGGGHTALASNAVSAPATVSVKNYAGNQSPVFYGKFSYAAAAAAVEGSKDAAFRHPVQACCSAGGGRGWKVNSKLFRDKKKKASSFRLDRELREINLSNRWEDLAEMEESDVSDFSDFSEDYLVEPIEKAIKKPKGSNVITRQQARLQNSANLGT